MHVVIMRGSFQSSDTSCSVFQENLNFAFEMTNGNGFDCLGVVLNLHFISADILPTLETIYEVFSEGLETHGVVILTSCASDQEREENLTYLKTVDANLAREVSDLFKHVNNRVIIIDNANAIEEKFDQVQGVIEVLKDMKKIIHQSRLTVDRIHFHVDTPPVVGRQFDMKRGSRSQSPGTPSQISEKAGLRVLLIGPSGHGKSATANSLLGLAKGDEKAFLSKKSAKTVTVELQKQSAQVNGRVVEVYESPAFSREDAISTFQESLHKAIAYSEVGFNCIAFVVRPARLCPEIVRAIVTFVSFLGSYSDVFAFFIFTCTKDQSERDLHLAEMKEILSNQKFENSDFITEMFDKCSKNVMIIENQPEEPQRRMDHVKRIWCTVGENVDKSFQLENFFKVLDNTKQKASIPEQFPEQKHDERNSAEHESTLKVNEEELQQVNREREMLELEKRKKIKEEFKSQSPEKESKVEIDAYYSQKSQEEVKRCIRDLQAKQQSREKELSAKEERLERQSRDMEKGKSLHLHVQIPACILL